MVNRKKPKHIRKSIICSVRISPDERKFMIRKNLTTSKILHKGFSIIRSTNKSNLLSVENPASSMDVKPVEQKRILRKLFRRRKK